MLHTFKKGIILYIYILSFYQYKMKGLRLGYFIDHRILLPLNKRV